ncbi:MAG: PilZ domain-containing protein [Pseudomonadota bacterium]
MNAPRGVFLEAQLKDISKEGVGLEVLGRALKDFSHEIGDKFELEILLPNGKKISFVAQIVTTSGTKENGVKFCGMKITDISYENQKTLGFFLMP